MGAARCLAPRVDSQDSMQGPDILRRPSARVIGRIRSLAPLFAGFLALHLAEDWSWMTMARYTSVPVYYLIAGTVVSAGLMTIWASWRRL